MLKTALSSVCLRALEPEDLDLVYAIENDEDLWEVSNACTPMSRFVIRQYLAVQQQDVFQSGELRLVIDDLERGRALGLIDLTDISVADGRAEVGIALLKEERGKGIGRVALQALMAYAHRNLCLRMLFAQISVHNAMSRALFESVGFEQVAVLPNWHRGPSGYEDLIVYQKML